MKPVEERKATGKLAELIEAFNDLPCEEKIRKISNTRVKMEKEVWLEKACEWINIHDSYSTPTNVLVENFREYMKGE